MLKFHPVANIFPLIEGDEFQRLVADIEEHGQKEEIIQHPDGRIIDGRNRYRAIQAIKSKKIEPRMVTYTGDTSMSSLIAFVMSLNEHRRHLDSDQRAACAVLATELVKGFEAEGEKAKKSGKSKDGSAGGRGKKKNLGEKVPQGLRAPKTAEKLAKQFGTNGRYVSDMKKLKDSDPESFKKIHAGQAKLTAVKKAKRKQATTLMLEDERKKREQAKPIVVADESVVSCTAMITDPPYGILKEPWEPAKLEEFTKEWSARWDGCGADLLAIFWSQRYLWEGRKWFDECFASYEFQQVLVWVYRNNKSAQSQMGFKQTWEPIFLYRRKGCKRKVKVNAEQWGGDNHDLDTHEAAVPQSNFKDAEEKRHPAQKPVSVMRWLVNTLTLPGELVCDPFTGSGTTGVACLQLGRSFHGIETNDEYRELAIGRIAAYGRELPKTADRKVSA